MDTIRTQATVEDNELSNIAHLSADKSEAEEDEDFDGDYFDDEPLRKPKGKKLKKMKSSYDR